MKKESGSETHERGGHLLREQSVKIRFCWVDAVFCCKID